MAFADKTEPVTGGAAWAETKISNREPSQRRRTRGFETADAGRRRCDQNFKPGTMEKWGLGPEDLKSLNPKLIYTRISGYGQTGPYSRKPGYASVTEAFSGFRYLNGFLTKYQYDQI
ncbi:MAG: hypothetical protein CM15mP120_20690 [Pseudomonadota bacterium]|nr:MAG: hypothetical protein CM15mP120_20690 [Pseudomonadota bacterium]